MSAKDINREKELNDFWNIEQLLPQKSKPSRSAVSTNRSMHIDAVEIDLGVSSAQGEQAVNDAPLTPSQPLERQAAKTENEKPRRSDPDIAYTPHHPLIREVRLYGWRSSFRFYERFCTMANRLFDCSGKPCERVSFFSYMPQYDQMNHAQLAWYLHWRDCVRAGTYPDTDYSYIFLYLFEIINLPSKIPPMEGQKLMCRIWKRYRDDYPLLNRYLADWICDFSLIHQLPAPADELSGSLRLIAEQSSFKEFYACPSGDDAMQDARIYLLFCTNYDYKKSKLYLAGSDRAAALNRHIPGALSKVLAALEKENKLFSSTKMQKATLSRDSFIGALCSNEMKRRIEVDYCSFHRSHELRFLITDIMKYSENKLRAYFGVKSKLSIYGLPDQIKAILDAYFSEFIPSRRSLGVTVAERPDYETLYDLPKAELSPRRAAEIEQASWTVTRQLVEAFEDDKTDSEIPTPPPQVLEEAGSTADSAQDSLSSALSPYRDFLLASLQENASAQRALARQLGCLPDAIAEKINDIAVDFLGDIVLQEGDSGAYAVIEDYEEEVRSALNQ